MKSEAPWTDEQVAGLNAWQACGYLHPFTCGSGDRMDAKHRAVQAKRGGDYGQLVATPEGWLCPACGYRQTWAHAVMLNGPPPRPPGFGVRLPEE